MRRPLTLLITLACITTAMPVQAAEEWTITNDKRQKVGSLYDPGWNRRVQIRDARGRIVGYVEKDGNVNDTRRRKILSIEKLLDKE